MTCAAVVAVLLALSAIGGTLALLLPAVPAALVVVIGVSWVLPGVVAFRRAYRHRPSALGLACLFGPSLGYAMSSLVLLGAWLAGIRTPWLLMLAPSVAFAIAWATPSLGAGLWTPRLTRRDLVAVALLVLIVPAVVARPYSRVGIDLPDGRAYRAYFTADFVWAMAVVSEVSKGDVLPANPYHLDQPLHYYWLAHLMPALEHRFFGRAVRLDHLLLANAVLSGVVFVGFLYGLARHVGGRAWPTAAGCALVITCSSAEGLYAIWDLWSKNAPFTILRVYNIDAITRWFFQTLPVDGLQRVLLYQPQHQFGYALALTALLVMLQQARRPTVRAAAVAGALLGAGLLLSTFSAFMAGCMTAVVAAWAVLRRRAWLLGLRQGTVAAVSVLAAIGLSQMLEYVVHGEGLIDFGLNPLLRRHAAIGLALSFGPAVLAMVPGLTWMAGNAAKRFRLLLPMVVIAVSLLFYFFVDVRDHQDVYVGWRAGHFIFVAATGVVAWGLNRSMRRCRTWRWKTAAAVTVALSVITGAPTTAIDLYNTQDISNREWGPGFPWTLVLTRAELDVLQWIRTSTPLDARVQVEPYTRDPATWAFIPAFAERRMAGGLPISMIPLEPYQNLSMRIRRVYQNHDVDEVFRETTALGIDVFVVGREERSAHPSFESTLAKRPDLFPLLFRRGDVSLYGASTRMRERARPEPIPAPPTG